jgi:hypothetical protein
MLLIPVLTPYEAPAGDWSSNLIEMVDHDRAERVPGASTS